MNRTILSLSAALIATAVFGQMNPGAQVIRFKLPIFNEEGYRSWYLRGERGTYVSETQVKIDDMLVSQYTGDEEGRRIATLTAPEAVFHFDTTTAYGPGELAVSTDNFEVTGKDWIWRGEDKEITLNQDVKVVLKQGIGDILK